MDSKTENLWVFLSHSNKDYEKVKLVRDLLEKKGYRPLLFFLKCLDEDVEIDTLIKREIDARNKFILCESENSRNSKWVQEEVDYIKSKGRMYETINLNDSLSKIKKIINNFNKRNTIFLSYAHKDYEFANTLYKELRRNNYKVFLEIDTLGNSMNIITNAINDAIKHGYVISLISEYYLSSSLLLEQLFSAYKKNRSGIIIIYLSNNLLLEEKINSNKNLCSILKEISSINATNLSSPKDIVEEIIQIDLDLHSNS